MNYFKENEKLVDKVILQSDLTIVIFFDKFKMN